MHENIPGHSLLLSDIQSEIEGKDGASIQIFELVDFNASIFQCISVGE